MQFSWRAARFSLDLYGMLNFSLEHSSSQAKTFYAPMQDLSDSEILQGAWKELYLKTLPGLALARDSAQAKWPVTLDHCFARIILDNTVGQGRQRWDERLKRPATKHMSCEQLEEAVGLAKRIASGKEDLVALDLQSLEVRGKTRKKKNRMEQLACRANDREEDISNTSENLVSEKFKTKRRNAEQDGVDAAVRPFKKTKTPDKQSVLSFGPASNQAGLQLLPSRSASTDQKVDLSPMLRKVQSHPTLTPYRKRLYVCLLSVPTGRYTTYAALSDFLHSSARAVGNGMRNNPFAPEIPCHRVLASDGSIGGFGGSWGIDGENASKKFDLLKEEGVRFDSRGKVKGPPFMNFVDLLDDK